MMRYKAMRDQLTASAGGVVLKKTDRHALSFTNRTGSTVE